MGLTVGDDFKRTLRKYFAILAIGNMGPPIGFLNSLQGMRIFELKYIPLDKI